MSRKLLTHELKDADREDQAGMEDFTGSRSNDADEESDIDTTADHAASEQSANSAEDDDGEDNNPENHADFEKGIALDQNDKHSRKQGTNSDGQQRVTKVSERFFKSHLPPSFRTWGGELSVKHTTGNRFFSTSTTGNAVAQTKSPGHAGTRIALKPSPVVRAPLFRNTSKQALSFVFNDKRRPPLSKQWASAVIVQKKLGELSETSEQGSSGLSVGKGRRAQSTHRQFFADQSLHSEGPPQARKGRLPAIAAARAVNEDAALRPARASKCMQTGTAELYPELSMSERKSIRKLPAGLASQATLDTILDSFVQAVAADDQMKQQEALDMLAARIKYKCNYCDKICIDERYMRRHIHLHTDVDGHDCPICGANFPTRDEFRMHHRAAHEGESNFRCDACDYKFIRASYLKIHLGTQAHADVVAGRCRPKPQVFKDGMPMHSQQVSLDRKPYTKKFEKIPPGEPEWDVVLPPELLEALHEGQRLKDAVARGESLSDKASAVRMCALEKAAKLINAPERRRTHDENGKLIKRGQKIVYTKLQQVRQLPVKIYRYNYCVICEKYVDNINPVAMQRHEQHLAAGQITTLAKESVRHGEAGSKSGELDGENSVAGVITQTNSAGDANPESRVSTDFKKLSYWKDISVDMVLPYYWQPDRTLEYVYQKTPNFLRNASRPPVIKKPDANDVDETDDEDGSSKKRGRRGRARHSRIKNDDDDDGTPSNKTHTQSILENIDFTDPDLLSYLNFDSSLKLSKHLTHRHRQLYYNSESNPLTHIVSASGGEKRDSRIGHPRFKPEAYDDEKDDSDEDNFVRIKIGKWQQALRLIGEQRLKIQKLEKGQPLNGAERSGSAEKTTPKAGDTRKQPTLNHVESLLRRSGRKRQAPVGHGIDKSTSSEEEDSDNEPSSTTHVDYTNNKPSRSLATNGASNVVSPNKRGRFAVQPQTVNIPIAAGHQTAALATQSAFSNAQYAMHQLAPQQTSSSSSSMYVRADRPEEVERLLQQGWTISGLLPSQQSPQQQAALQVSAAAAALQRQQQQAAQWPR